MKLDGKVVLITGASEGLGAACAAAFRARGAKLALTARSEHKLRQVGGAESLVIAADLMQPEKRGTIVEATLKHFGRIDVLVNNAGLGLYAPAAETPHAQSRALFELNFFAPLEITQFVVPFMRKQRSGTIVNISSIAGKLTLPWLTVYSASKHALSAWTDGLRVELRRDGIHAMSVCPGYISTDFQSHVLAGTPPLALRRGRPLGITAERCANSIVRGVERGARTIMTPATGWLAVAAARLFPGLADLQLERMYHIPR